MSVYTLKNTSGDTDVRFLNGDLKQVHPSGYEFPAPGYISRIEDGTFLNRIGLTQGVHVDATHLPTKVKWGNGGKKPLEDIVFHNCFIVRDSVRDLIEKIEPNIHQFEPLDIERKAGSTEGAGRYYWMIILNRLDSMDREKTTHTLHRELSWKPSTGGTFVVNLNQVGGCHIWIDKRVHGGWVFVSQTFKQHMDTSGVTGIGYHEIPTTQ